jgi:hypothetical protein
MLTCLCHAFLGKRKGLITGARVTHAGGYTEHDAVLLMLAQKQAGRLRRIAVGADGATATQISCTWHVS